MAWHETPKPKTIFIRPDQPTNSQDSYEVIPSPQSKVFKSTLGQIVWKRIIVSLGHLANKSFATPVHPRRSHISKDLYFPTGFYSSAHSSYQGGIQGAPGWKVFILK